MGLPGPVHSTGVVGSSAILPGWAGTHAAERMADRLSMPVWLGNDANLGALAESTWGAGRDAGGLVYLKLATGIGAGIVIDGRLFEGAGGTAGEIGHTSLDETGDICRCGNRGCLETYASGSAIAGLLSRSLGEALDPRRRAGARRRRRPRLPARARRRRPPHRRGGRQPLQSDQPRADRRRGQHGRRRRGAARSAPRGGWTTSHPERGRGRADRPRASSGSVPSCSARWRSCSTKPVPHGAVRRRRSNSQRQQGRRRTR